MEITVEENVHDSDNELCKMHFADCCLPSPAPLMTTPLAGSSTQPSLALPNIPAHLPLLPAQTLPENQTRTGSAFTPATPAVGLESGTAYTVMPDFQKAQHCFTNQDRSLMRLCSMLDEADCPLYFCDKVLAQVKIETSRSKFDLSNPALTKRQPFMARMHRKFPSPRPEAITVQLESFPNPMTICRFDAMQQLKAHLLRHDLCGNLDQLNVHPDHRWNQSVRQPSTHLREVTDSPWFKGKVSEVKIQTFSPPTFPALKKQNQNACVF
jgi:hypothetical protein